MLGVYAYGFERPSAIQQRAIMPVIKGSRTITLAQGNNILMKISQDLMSSLRLSPALERPQPSPSQSFRRLTLISRPAKR